MAATLSKAKIKWVNQLSQKKYRKLEGLFVAEGDKMVQDMLDHFVCRTLFYTCEYTGKIVAKEACQVTYDELCRLSRLQTPQHVLAVFEMPATQLHVENLKSQLILALDGIQDAGNMGTIIRLADWFGISTIVCSPDTVDVYNPKVVQATMGALARVGVHYVDLVSFLPTLQMPIYVTALDGNNIYTTSLTENGVIVMGNEGNGVSDAVKALATHSLLIPNFPVGSLTSESLNVGVAASIVCAEFRRRQLLVK
jgi:TrmH family RNA methyltransferase